MFVKNKINVIIGILVLAVIVIIGYSAVHHLDVCVLCSLKGFSAQSVRHWIQGFGRGAIVIFVLLYTLNTFSPFFPPIFILSLSAGALFGSVFGIIALTLGVFFGTTAAFFVARYLGSSWIKGLIKGKGEKYYNQLSDNGFFILLPIRLIGLPPYGIIDFICGLSRMRYFDFVAATIIGTMPSIIIQVVLADRLAIYTSQFVWNSPQTWFDPVLLGLVGSFVIMIVVTGKIVKKKQNQEAGVQAV